MACLALHSARVDHLTGFSSWTRVPPMSSVNEELQEHGSFATLSQSFAETAAMSMNPLPEFLPGLPCSGSRHRVCVRALLRRS